ncbi:hypothetical protein YC2023_106089 [Brassica napus]
MPAPYRQTGSPNNQRERTRVVANNAPSQSNNIEAQGFSFRELATATNNFKLENLIGEGGFGRVYKGKLDKTGQVVAVKQLDRNGLQGQKEFLVEVLMLSLLHHSNLVNLIGYCADGDQRLLVYEYMPLGSVEDHLLDFDTKLSDFGLAKLGPTGDTLHVSSRVMGTYGYCAPEYQRTGHLTVKSDVYSFGVVLLELITGRRVIDTMRPSHEINLVTWAQPIFRDPTRFPQLADPLLRGEFPEKSLNQAVAVAAMCLNEEPMVRPLISDVVTALSFLGASSDFSNADSSHLQQNPSEIYHDAVQWDSSPR